MGPRPPNMVWSVVAAVLLLVVGGIAAISSAIDGARFMKDLDQDVPALARVGPRLDPPGPRLSRRVVLVIVDGLRFDESERLPFLNELRQQGAHAPALSQYPTYSIPNYINILTGVPPEASGVRTNRHRRPVGLDSLMARVRHHGMTAAYASDYDAMPRLFMRPPPGAPPPEVEIDALLDPDASPEAISVAVMMDLRSDFDDSRYAPWPGGLRDSANALMNGERDDALVVMLIGVLDAAGHAYGGDSEEYRAAAVRADDTLSRILEDVDLTQDTVVMVADHGHTDRGGHGGLEPNVVRVPLILVGKGIVPGADIREPKLQDVAPTVARLLGVEPPGHALGRTLVEALAVDEETRNVYRVQDDARAARNAAIVSKAVYDHRRDRLEQRAVRLGFLVVGGLTLLAGAWWLWRRGGLRLDWKALALGVPAFFIVYYILIAILGQRFSPSLLPARENIATELLKYGIAATVVQIGAGWWALRKKLQLPERLAAANGIALVGMGLAMTPVALLWTLFPPPYVEMPGPTALVLIPAVEVSVALYAIGTALSLFIEVVVFFARAVDPRVRLLRLERALEKTREQAESVGGSDLAPRKRERRVRAAARRPRPSPTDPDPASTGDVP